EAAAIRHRLVEQGRAELANDLAMTLMNLGLALEPTQPDVSRRNYDEAISLWEAAVQDGQVHLLPYLLKAYHIRFDLARQQQDWDGAAADLLRALELVLEKTKQGSLTLPEQQE